MNRALFKGFLIACFVLLSLSSVTQAQSLPRAGRYFSFGIIEGAEQLAPPGSTSIFLTVVSPYSGTGTVISGLGFSTTFSFAPNVATIVSLPDSLANISDLGLRHKAIYVQTTQSINLVLHDFISDAGEATQIFPDESLDHNYIVSEWGLWNDPSDGEDNRSEFLITTVGNEEAVTITPSVRTMLGQPAGVPFTITLNRGDCYMVKADTTAGSLNTSLAGSVISSRGPVSVIVGTTCAYVPLAFQSCNELMDELIGRKWWGKQFFVQPLGNADSAIEVIITGDTDFVAKVSTSGGATLNLVAHSGNRSGAVVSLEFFGSAEIETTVPVQLHQLTRGSFFANNGQSDPSIVSILPLTMYPDTFFWNVPHLVDPGFQPFTNWAPIIYPAAQMGNILLDGVPLSSIPNSQLLAPPQSVAGTAMSAINPMVAEGVHLLTSPVPVFALATGFNQADAYSFIPGGVAAVVKAAMLPRMSDLERGDSPLLSAYPNPAHTTLTVASIDPVGTLSLVDPLSRTVLRVPALNGRTIIDVTDIPSGSYVLRGSSMSETASIRVTIVH